jgi:hypothetical protein
VLCGATATQTGIWTLVGKALLPNANTRQKWGARGKNLHPSVFTNRTQPSPPKDARFIFIGIRPRGAGKNSAPRLPRQNENEKKKGTSLSGRAAEVFLFFFLERIFLLRPPFAKGPHRIVPCERKGEGKKRIRAWPDRD